MQHANADRDLADGIGEKIKNMLLAIHAQIITVLRSQVKGTAFAKLLQYSAGVECHE